MRKKTIGIIVISLIIINFVFIGLVLSSGNEPRVRITTNKTIIREGEEVEVSILGDKICGLNFSIYYDSQKLQLVTPVEVFNDWNKAEEENAYFFHSSNFEILDEEKVICKFTFKALENITPGDTSISYSNIDITDEEALTESKGNIDVPIRITTEEFLVNVNYSTTEITKDDVTVSLVSNKEVQDISGWTKSADGKELTKDYSNNVEEAVTVTDIAGNETIANIKIDNIDKIAPTLEVGYSTTAPTNEDVQVTITSNEEVQSVSGWTRSSDKKVLTKSYSNNIEEAVIVKDIAGNTSTANIKIDNIDPNIPGADITAPTLSVSYSTEELTNQDVEVTITSDEEVQDISGWNKSSDGKILTKSYSENVEEIIVVKDLVGNESNATIEIDNIDKSGPVLGVEYNTTELTNQDVRVTITSNEDIQDVSGWTKSENERVLTKTYSNNVDENIIVKDLAGNEVTQNIKIANIDKTAPTINVSYDTTNLTDGEVKVTITSNEEIQDVNGWTKSSDGKSLIQIFYENTEESVTVKDMAGNESVANIEITNIDRIAPNVSVSYSTTKPTMRSVEVTVTSNEPVQDIIGWTKSADGKVLTKEYENNIEEFLIVNDLAGNETIVEIIITNINSADTPSTDTTAPIVDVTCSTEELTNENVQVTITSNEAVQDVDGWTKSSDGKELTKEYSKNTEETVIVKDLAGNETIVDIKIDNIDKEAPRLDVEYSKTEPTNGNVQVTLKSNEEIQDVNGWTKSSNGKELTKDYSSNTEESVTIKDLAGNETTANIKIENIDKTAPNIDVRYSITRPTNENVEVTIISNEEIQDVNGWTKSSNGKELTKEYSSNAEEAITIKDLAGNESTANIKIENIDKTAPIINVRYSITRPVNGDVEAIITANEEVQEVDGWERSVNGKQLTKTYKNNTEEKIVIKDILGNETTANIKIENIDKTAPSVSVRYSTTEPTEGEVQVTITSNEELQDVNGWVKSNSGKVLTRTYTNNVEETVSIKDIAGNEQNVEVVIRNITHNSNNDSEPIVLDVTYTTENDKVIVTIQSNNELQKVDGWELSSNKKRLTKEYDRNKTEEVIVKDIYGNQKTVSVVVTNVPKKDIDIDNNTINNNTVNENKVNNIDDNNIIINNTTIDNKTNENKTNSTDKPNSIVENKDAGTHDNTMSDEELPYTGNTIKFIAIGLISVLGIVLYVKFKKEYEGV